MLLLELGQVLAQHIGCRSPLVQDPADAGQAQSQLPQDKDLLQSQQPAPVVEALPPVPGAGRREQTDTVVMSQGATGDASGLDDLLRRPLHLGHDASINSSTQPCLIYSG